MNKKMMTFGLLTTIAIAAPIAVVVSCGEGKKVHRKTLASGRVNRVDQTQDLKTGTLRTTSDKKKKKTAQATINTSVK